MCIRDSHITLELVEEAELLPRLVVHGLPQIADAVDAGAEALELRVLGREALAGRHGCHVGLRRWCGRRKSAVELRTCVARLRAG